MTKTHPVTRIPVLIAFMSMAILGGCPDLREGIQCLNDQQCYGDNYVCGSTTCVVSCESIAADGGPACVQLNGNCSLAPCATGLLCVGSTCHHTCDLTTGGCGGDASCNSTTVGRGYCP